jgi:hypothetical protein
MPMAQKYQCLQSLQKSMLTLSHYRLESILKLFEMLLNLLLNPKL